MKHSRASMINVRMQGSGEALEVKITDDGKGFDEGHKANNGLVNMKKRIEEIGGTLVIETAPGKGTSVGFTIPLN